MGGDIQYPIVHRTLTLIILSDQLHPNTATAAQKHLIMQMLFPFHLLVTKYLK
jgi:hypothetical protein